MTLKTLFTIAAIGLLFGTPIYAQDADKLESPWTFGAKLGFNASKNNASGINWGGFVEYRLQNNFFILSGLEFSVKKSFYNLSAGDPVNNHKKGSEDSFFYFAEINPIYLEVPINIAYRIRISNTVKFTLHTGIYGAIAIKKDGYYGSFEQRSSITEEGNNTSEYLIEKLGTIEVPFFDYGVIFGGAIEFFNFSYNVKQEYGLVNIDKDWKALPIILPQSFKCTTVSITYRF